MSTTEKRLTVAFSREQLQELKELCETMQERPSSIIHRAITMLHYDRIGWHKKSKDTQEGY
jgi:hypothetical protein